jgi:hypothetical protein
MVLLVSSAGLGTRRGGAPMILELWLGFRELLRLLKEIEGHRSSIYREFGIKS